MLPIRKLTLNEVSRSSTNLFALRPKPMRKLSGLNFVKINGQFVSMIQCVCTGQFLSMIRCLQWIVSASCSARGSRAAQLEENGGSQVNVAGDDQAPMRIVNNYKRPEERIPAERDPTKFVVSPITGELIPISEMEEHMRISLTDPKYKEQKERMLAKIKETTLAPDDEISQNIVGLASTRPDIFGTTEEEVSNAVKAEIEKKKDEQPKQVIWDGHSGSIGRTATHALSQIQGGEEQFDASNVAGRPIPGPAPLVRPGMPLPRPPQPLPLVRNDLLSHFAGDIVKNRSESDAPCWEADAMDASEEREVKKMKC
jgi:hypothetical protein